MPQIGASVLRLDLGRNNFASHVCKCLQFPSLGRNNPRFSRVSSRYVAAIELQDEQHLFHPNPFLLGPSPISQSWGSFRRQTFRASCSLLHGFRSDVYGLFQKEGVQCNAVPDASCLNHIQT
jgi:hypothetical protein